MLTLDDPIQSETVRSLVRESWRPSEGLDQAFNSLDAQREACAAYVKCQASLGWKVIAKTYDDGGFSGGTMDRPALKDLLEDIKAGRVDVVIVYKIDRPSVSMRAKPCVCAARRSNIHSAR
jgi:site-specific DNA recombinase